MTQPPILAEAVKELSGKLSEQTVGIASLEDSIKQETAARDRKVQQLQRVVTALVIGLVLLLGGLATNIAVLIQQNNGAKERAAAATEQRNRQSADTQKLLAAIEGCTQPGGACFRANREDTAAALVQLQQFSYVTGYCATVSTSATDYQSCVKSFPVPGAPTSLPKKN